MKKPRSFGPLEISKMLQEIEDNLAKIHKVVDSLQKAGNIQDSMLLIQACRNLVRVREKLEDKPRKSRKGILKKARRILTEKIPPKNSSYWNFQKNFPEDQCLENLHFHG